MEKKTIEISMTLADLLIKELELGDFLELPYLEKPILIPKKGNIKWKKYQRKNNENR